MTNRDFIKILNYIDVLIDQSTAIGNADYIVEALDQIQNLIKFHVDMLEEDDDEL